MGRLYVLVNIMNVCTCGKLVLALNVDREPTNMIYMTLKDGYVMFVYMMQFLLCCYTITYPNLIVLMIEGDKTGQQHTVTINCVKVCDTNT